MIYLCKTVLVFFNQNFYKIYLLQPRAPIYKNVNVNNKGDSITK